MDGNRPSKSTESSTSANGENASPALHSGMVAEDRWLRLAAFEVYRFGGAERMKDGADKMLTEFFDQLAERKR